MPLFIKILQATLFAAVLIGAAPLIGADKAYAKKTVLLDGTNPKCTARIGDPLPSYPRECYLDPDTGALMYPSRSAVSAGATAASSKRARTPKHPMEAAVMEKQEALREAQKAYLTAQAACIVKYEAAFQMYRAIASETLNDALTKYAEMQFKLSERDPDNPNSVADKAKKLAASPTIVQQIEARSPLLKANRIVVRQMEKSLADCRAKELALEKAKTDFHAFHEQYVIMQQYTSDRMVNKGRQMRQNKWKAWETERKPLLQAEEKRRADDRKKWQETKLAALQKHEKKARADAIKARNLAIAWKTARDAEEKKNQERAKASKEFANDRLKDMFPHIDGPILEPYAQVRLESFTGGVCVHAGKSSKNGANLQSRKCSDKDSGQFLKAERKTADHFSLVHQASNKCLEIENGLMESGVQIVLSKCNGAAQQLWRMRHGKDKTFVNLQSAKSFYCLNLPGNGKQRGTSFQQLKCDAKSQTQRFRPKGVFGISGYRKKLRTEGVIDQERLFELTERIVLAKNPGKAVDIGVGANGSVWMAAADGNAYSWSGSSWKKQPGLNGVTRIDVGPGGRAWAIDGKKQVWRNDGKWHSMDIAANDIGVGADGSVWVISNEKNQYGYGIFRFAGLYGWRKASGSATRIDVDDKGNAWTVNNKNEVWYWNGESRKWEQKPGKAIDISIGANGTTMMINQSTATPHSLQTTEGIESHCKRSKGLAAIGCISFYAAQAKGMMPNTTFVKDKLIWNRLAGSSLQAVSVDKNGAYWGVKTDGSIWAYGSAQKTPSAGFSYDKRPERLLGQFMLKVAASEKCLDKTESNDNGARHHQWTCDEKNRNQIFVAEYVDDENFRLKNILSNRCIDIKDSSAKSGAIVHQWDCLSDGPQDWRISRRQGKWFQLTAAHSKKCLDLAGGSKQNGGNLQQWECQAKNDRQLFTAIPVEYTAVSVSQKQCEATERQDQGGKVTFRCLKEFRAEVRSGWNRKLLTTGIRKYDYHSKPPKYKSAGHQNCACDYIKVHPEPISQINYFR